MNLDLLQITNGKQAGAWIKPRLDGSFGAVTLQVPQGFEAYARIFHPAIDLDLNPVRWTDVAEALGTTPHREMQWHSILGFSGPEELQVSYGTDSKIGLKWKGHDPPAGRLNPDQLDTLCEILSSFCLEGTPCYFGLCTILSWLNDFSEDELEPLLSLPYGRDYIVLCGPLVGVSEVARGPSTRSPDTRISVVGEGENGSNFRDELSRQTRRQSPNLIWPEDHAWLVASEVDFDSTLVGGSSELVHAIVESPTLEAWEVGPDTSLAADADKVNTPSR